jgi:hypothetical protein
VSYEFVGFLGAGSKEEDEVYIVVENVAVAGGYVELEKEEFKEQVIIFFSPLEFQFHVPLMRLGGHNNAYTKQIGADLGPR